jgi:hypothetical protein
MDAETPWLEILTTLVPSLLLIVVLVATMVPVYRYYAASRQIAKDTLDELRRHNAALEKLLAQIVEDRSR